MRVLRIKHEPLRLLSVSFIAVSWCGLIRTMNFDLQKLTVFGSCKSNQEAFAELAARGVEFERSAEMVAKMEDHELWMAFLRDPDGNLVEVAKYL